MDGIELVNFINILSLRFIFQNYYFLSYACSMRPLLLCFLVLTLWYDIYILIFIVIYMYICIYIMTIQMYLYIYCSFSGIFFVLSLDANNFFLSGIMTRFYDICNLYYINGIYMCIYIIIVLYSSKNIIYLLYNL